MRFFLVWKRDRGLTHTHTKTWNGFTLAVFSSDIARGVCNFEPRLFGWAAMAAEVKCEVWVTRFSHQHITMHPLEEERGQRQRLPALEGHWGRPVPDFIRKSILLFFFGAVGYFIKNKKPFDSILEERGKQQLTVSASLSSTCNLPTSHLHLRSCPSHISITLFPTLGH